MLLILLVKTKLLSTNKFLVLLNSFLNQLHTTKRYCRRFGIWKYVAHKRTSSQTFGNTYVVCSLSLFYLILISDFPSNKSLKQIKIIPTTLMVVVVMSVIKTLSERHVYLSLKKRIVPTKINQQVTLVEAQYDIRFLRFVLDSNLLVLANPKL